MKHNRKLITMGALGLNTLTSVLGVANGMTIAFADETTEQVQLSKEELREQKLQALKEEFEKVSGKIVMMDNRETTTKSAEVAKKVQKMNLVSEQESVKSKITAIEDEIAKEKAEKEKADKDAKWIQQINDAISGTANVGASTRAFDISNTSSNTYPWGQCTWGVKNLAPWVGEYWGNANKWENSAKAEGYSTGTTPVAGSIIVWLDGAYGHVAMVKDVDENGNIQIYESNYGGSADFTDPRGLGNYRGWFNPTTTGRIAYIYPKV